MSCKCHIVTAAQDAVSLTGGMHAVQKLVVADGFVIGTFLYFPCQNGDLPFEASEFGECRKCLLEDSGCVGDLHLLLEVTDSQLAGPFNGA